MTVLAVLENTARHDELSGIYLKCPALAAEWLYIMSGDMFGAPISEFVSIFKDKNFGEGWMLSLISPRMGCLE